MGLSVMTAGFRIALLLIIILHFSTALDGKRQSDSNAAPKVVKRATNGNLDQDEAGKSNLCKLDTVCMIEPMTGAAYSYYTTAGLVM